MNVQTKKEGFTIIEVVLVLAIAGLIFLMVFIALPALQRNQRDTARKNDMSRAQTAIVNAANDNRGKLPTLNNAFIAKYLAINGDEFVDPAGKNYAFAELTEATSPTGFDGTDSGQTAVRVYYTTGAVCAGDGAVTLNQGARKVALRLVLEGGGVSCVNN
jgi:prepilin-type N-terminal cleavage/methylation domain-containing protein